MIKKAHHYLLVKSICIFCLTLFFTTECKASSREKYHQEINGIQALISANPDSALNLINKQLTIHYLHKDKPKIMDFNLLKIELYIYKKDFSLMKIQLFKTIQKIDKTTTNHQKLLISYFKLVNEYQKIKKDKFYSELHKIVQESLNRKYFQLVAKCYSLSAHYQIEKKHLAAASKDITRASAYYSKAHDKIGLLKNQNLTAYIAFLEKNYEKSLSLLNSGLIACKQMKLKDMEVNTLADIATCYFQKEDYLKAKSFIQQIIKDNNQLNYECLLNNYQLLGDIYEKLNMLDSSYFYIQKMIEFNDQAKIKADLNLADEIEKSFEKKIQQELLQNKTAEVKHVKKINRLILFFLIIGSSLFIFTLYAYRSKIKLNKVLLGQQSSILEKNKIIDAALQEKVVLLKEIHHRVKNNLQIISSLLNLQTRNIDDPLALSVLEEGKERIQAIALIHQKLYQTDSFATIDMEGYIVDLTQQLNRTYISQKKISITILAKEIALNLDTAVPVGLIICELVTNTFKHAFTTVETGNLEIRLFRETFDATSFSLEVKDDGIGFNPEDKKSGLGSEIIEALTDQLDGSLSISSSEKGTCIKISFKQIES